MSFLARAAFALYMAFATVAVGAVSLALIFTALLIGLWPLWVALAALKYLWS